MDTKVLYGPFVVLRLVYSRHLHATRRGLPFHAGRNSAKLLREYCVELAVNYAVAPANVRGQVAMANSTSERWTAFEHGKFTCGPNTCRTCPPARSHYHGR